MIFSENLAHFRESLQSFRVILEKIQIVLYHNRGPLCLGDVDVCVVLMSHLTTIVS